MERPDAQSAVASVELSAPAVRFTEWGLLLLNLLVIGATSAALWLGWRGELRDAERGVQSTGQLLAHSVADKLDKVAVGLDALARQLEAARRTGDIDRDGLWPLIDASRARLPEVQTLAVFDAAGQQVCGTLPADRCRRLDVADRPYFQAAREQTGSEIRLSGPVDSRLDGQRVLVMARPLRGPDGSFAGVVLALLPMDKAQALLQSARKEAGSAASLRMADMTLVVRDPPLPPGAAEGALSDRLRSELKLHPDGSLYRAPAGTDGVDRITFYQRLPGWPLYVLVGSAASDVLATWRVATGLAVVFLVGLAAGSVLLARANRLQVAEARRAQHLYETAPCGYHTLDVQGRFISINRTELEWLGKPANELIGQRSPRDFFSPDSQQTFDASFPALRTQGRLDNLQLELIDRDGQVRHVVVSARAVVDDQGGFIGSNSVMHDITPLRRAEQQLRALSEQQAQILANDLIGMVRLRDRHILWSNPGMTRLLGYTEAEFQGMSMRRLYPDDASFERVGVASRAHMVQGRTHRIELQLLHKDGTVRWLDAGAAPLAGDAGQMLVTLADITDRKAAEALKLRAVELQAHNEQLIETTRLQDEFLANMSHELRTPLNGILGLGGLMPRAAKAGDEDKLLRYTDQIMSSGQRLLTLVQTQLDFARAEAGKMPMEPQAVDLPAVLADLAELMQPVAEAGNVMLESACDPPLQTVMVDPMRLRQVLSLLLENAVKFSPQGGRVLVRAFAPNAQAWSVEVVDKGIGIAPADHERIFGKFVQLSSGATKQFGGAGMGLALARKLARAMEGDISVRSELGSGSTFTLSMPMLKVERQDASSSPMAG